jgi:hypothetical protein
VLRGRRERFAFGVLTTGFAAIFLINALNPDALIARINVDRMEAGKEFDAYYLTHLSADAAPVLVESLPRMSEPDRRMVEESLHARWDEGRDWRTPGTSAARGHDTSSMPGSRSLKSLPPA